MRVKSELEVMVKERKKLFGRYKRMHSSTMSDGVLRGSMAMGTLPRGGTLSMREE